MVARQGRGYEAGVWEQGWGLIPQFPTTMLADSLLLLALFLFFFPPTGTLRIPELYLPPVCPGLSRYSMILGREGRD